MRRAGSASPTGRSITVAFSLAVGFVALGLWNRGESDLAASEGLGYALGIAGLACMTALLAYSLRKRVPALRNAGRVSSWFQVHMMLGLFGPVAILYHCNFSLGSLNSNVSLACALVVAGSGVVGRVIYTRIHHGLSDRRRTLAELKEGIDEARRDIAQEGSMALVRDQLDELESRVTRPRSGVLDGLWAYLSLGHVCRRTLRRARRELRREMRKRGESRATQRARARAVTRHVAAIREVGTLGAYERFFALWHVLHLPLCFLLFISAAVHVIAVHIY